MNFEMDTLFSLSSNLAMIGWLLLIAAPKRWTWLLVTCGIVIPCVLGALYGGLMMTYFTSAEGGGYGSLGQVKALLSEDGTLLAGWIHYLAFDLAIGAIIAREADAAGLSRIVQIPILLATFMFGPVGFLLFHLTRSGWRAVGGAKVAA